MSRERHYRERDSRERENSRERHCREREIRDLLIYSIIISIIYSIIISIIILGLERTRFELLRAASSCSVRRSVSCHDDSTPRRVAIGGTLQCGAKTSAVVTYESYDPVN